MTCDQLSRILDDHRQAHLTRAERGALDSHLAGCEACTHAWHGHAALSALRVPAPSKDLLRRVLKVAGAEPATGSRPARARVLLATALLAGGAALAAVTMVASVLRAPRPAVGASETLPAPASTAPTDGSPAGVAPRVPGPAATLLVDGDAVMIVSTAPRYPLEALRDNQNGNVVVQYDITAAGATDNVSVVSSTDPRFEAPAVEAVAQWKYLPRIAGGERVASSGLRTVIRFQMQPDAEPTSSKAATPSRSADVYAALQRSFTLAWERLGRDDAQGAELALDELRATHELGPYELGRLYDIYGYIYTVYRDYGRAIAAYETAIGHYAQSPAVAQGQWMTLAKLYFARNQYDMALRTIVTYRERLAAGGHDPKDLPPEAYDFVDRLRALGVTEETL